jgi:hypothetical protein
VGAVTVIVPVAVEQVGCVVLAVGVAGAEGGAAIITIVADEAQLNPFFAVT